MRLDLVLAVTEWLTTRRLRSRLVTNGHGRLLNPDTDVVGDLALVGLDAVTVSLNAADPETYDLLCRPTFSKSFREVIHFAEACVEAGIATTLTAVDLPEADIEGCRAIADALGASFRLRPHVPPPEHEAAPSESGRDDTMGQEMTDPGSKILLVDDEEAIQKLLRFPLEKEGYQVVQARDGQEALDAFAREPFDLVILDVMMPRIDGTEVCRRLRAVSTVPIIMLTAKADEFDKVLGLEIGADDYITKDRFSLREFRSRVRAQLRRADMARQAGAARQDLVSSTASKSTCPNATSTCAAAASISPTSSSSC